jgi:basic membrane protein A
MKESISEKPIIIVRFASLALVITVGLLLTGIWLHFLQPEPVQADPIGVGLVTDGPTVEDGGYNWLSYQGLMRAEGELEVIGSVYTSTSPADYGPNLDQCVMDGNALCLSVGFMTGEAISNAATAYSSTLFAVVDGTFQTYPDNLRGISFVSEEAGYLAGTLAALMSESGKVGAVGGLEIPPVTSFIQPYQQGALCADGDVTTVISYTNTFVDPTLGAETAQGMIAQGVDVIFAAAGPTGNGAILTATQSGAWAIGVDVDQYFTVFMSGTVPGSDHMLTSAMKRIDNAVFATVSDVISGTFTSGTALFGLANEGVGLAPFHEADPSVSQGVKDHLDWVTQGIIDGVIHVEGPCPSRLFLPLAIYTGSP